MSDEDCNRQKMYILLTLSKTTMLERLVQENQRNMQKYYLDTIFVSEEKMYLRGAKLMVLVKKCVGINSD